MDFAILYNFDLIDNFFYVFDEENEYLESNNIFVQPSLLDKNEKVLSQLLPIDTNYVNFKIKYSYNTAKSFSEQLDLWAQGKWNNKSQLLLFWNTPKLYLKLGLNDKPITISSSKLERIVYKKGKQKGNYHNLGLETTKQLPTAIANPLNILESATVDDSIVVVTELSDSNDRIIVVSMVIDGNGHIEVTDVNSKKEIMRLPSNVMTSAYGRNNYESWMQQNKDRIIYDIDDGIIKKESTASGYNCQRASTLMELLQRLMN